ncbi:MAG: hypothetical protein OMM_10018, partial [Candidatus Magnetoglobus multicellularis str. Araruama]
TIMKIAASDVSAFAGINGPNDSPTAIGFGFENMGFGLTIANSAIEDDDRSWLAMKAMSDSPRFYAPGMDQVTIEANNIGVYINKTLVGDETYNVMDFSEKPMDLNVGEETIILDFDGDKEEFLSIEGSMHVNLFNFVTIDGNLAFEKFTQYVTLDNSYEVAVDMLTLGASDVNAFAGINGPADNENAIGFQLNDLNLGLALIRPYDTNDDRSWVSLKATAGKTGFISNIDGVDITADALEVNINKAATDESLVDWSVNPLNLYTGNNQTMTIDMDSDKGEIMSIEGHMTLNLFDFFHLESNIAFESFTQEISASYNDGSTNSTYMDMLTVGINNANAFVGVGGPGNSDGAIGFNLSDVNLGLAIMTAPDWNDTQYISMKAIVGEASFVGVEGLTVAVSDMMIGINQVKGDTDHAHFVDNPLSINTGDGTTIDIDFDGSRGELLIIEAQAELNVFDFFHVKANLAFEKFTRTLDLVEAETFNTYSHEADMLTIGASDIEAFVGVGGPADSGDAIGFTISNVDFALALSTLVEYPGDKYFSLKATAGAASFIGVDGLDIGVDDLTVSINDMTKSATNVEDYANFKDNSLAVNIGNNKTMTLDFDGNKGRLLSINGTMSLNLFDFFSVSGSLSFTKFSRKDLLIYDVNQNELTTDVDVLAVAGSDLDAFVGLGGKDDGFGFSLSDVSFGLALMNSLDYDASATSFKANVGAAEFVGIPGITIGASDVNVEINQGNIDNDTAIAHLKTDPLNLKAGDDTITLDYDGSSGHPIMRITGHFSLNLFDFFTVEADLGFEKQIKEIDTYYYDNETKYTSDMDILSVGAKDVDAFIGINGPAAQPGAIGLSLSDVDFGLAFMDAKEWDAQYISVKADIGSVGIVGVEGLTLESTNLQFRLNEVINDEDVAHLVDNPLVIKTGTEDADIITLDYDSKKGRFLRAEGALKMGIADFIINGSFSVENGGNNKLLIGAAGGDIFLGKGEAPYNDGNDMGVLVNDTQFGLILSPEYKLNMDFSDSSGWLLAGEDEYFSEGELILTPNKAFQKGAALYNNYEIPTANSFITEFRYYSGDGSGGDGIVFFLVDGDTEELVPGNFGGSLGYSDNNVNPDSSGLDNGWLGIGFDEYGYFASKNDQDDGFSSGQQPGIVYRGSDGKGYPYAGIYQLKDKIDGGWRNVQIFFDKEYNRVITKLDYDDDGIYDVSSYLNRISSNKFDDLPETFKFGFAGSCGGATNLHKIDYVKINSITPESRSKMSLFAQGQAAIIGVPDVTIAGKLQLMMNTAGVIDETITLPDPNNPETTLSIPIKYDDNIPIGLAGTLDLNILNSVTMSGGFAFNKLDNKLIIGASELELFMGKGPAKIDGEINPDASGLLLHECRLGMVIYDSESYAVDASGTATILGIKNLDLSGSLGFQLNTTGEDIAETILVPLPDGSLS